MLKLGDKNETNQKTEALYFRNGICNSQPYYFDGYFLLHIYGVDTMNLDYIFENYLSEFIRYGEYDPSERALTLIWHEVSKHDAATLLSEAINGDEKLSRDVCSMVFFRDAGDQTKARINQSLCNYVKIVYVDPDESYLWKLYESQCRPDPMTLAKEESYMDQIAGNLKDVF